jgi:phosphoribosylformimino-5-aminoimidazole carboxamide ribotide isomerase
MTPDPFRLLGVIDIRHGRAVRARGGQRDRYQAVDTIAGEPITSGDAVALAKTYRDRLGLHEIYVADLDAIMTGEPQDTTVSALASLGVSLWLDAGIRSRTEAHRAMALGAARIIVGLETLPSFDILTRICDDLGGDRVVFSLDLRDGQPIVARGHVEGETPQELARRAALAGAGTVIVLDLARVGTGVGLDLDVIRRIHRAVPGLTLLAGGGVRGLDDLVALRHAGCDGALIATALHEGRLRPNDVRNAFAL